VIGKVRMPEANRNTTRVPLPELNNRIVVDKAPGQIFLRGPVLSLQFPMIIARHGQTAGNERGVAQGRADEPDNQLNEMGRRQARQLAINLFHELEMTLGSKLPEMAEAGKLIVLKSPIKRAQDTARYFLEYFKERTGIQVGSLVEGGLTEISFGKIDGLALEDIKDEALRDLVVRYRTTQDATINWQGTGESFVDTLIRAKSLIESLNAAYKGKDVVVISFTHGTFGSSLRTVAGDRSLLKDDDMVAFRDNILEVGNAYWLSKVGLETGA
jgi:broad specificity phosphatase PhoE